MAKEEAYFELIEHLQSRIKSLKDARSDSSSILHSFAHRCIALAISGFGTIISMLVGIFATILYPFMGRQGSQRRAQEK